MFNDAHLPDTDAWAAMTRDLRQSKESRNALTKENSYVSAIDSGRTRMRAHSFLRQLKRRLAEIESEKEEYVPHVPFRGHLGPSYHGASYNIRLDRWGAILRRHGLIS
jgi:hypothetical protein